MSQHLKHYPTDYSLQYQTIINILSISKKPVIKGSFSEHGLLYPADVDIEDTVNLSMPETKCINYLCKQIKHVVKELMKQSNLIIGDIKAGERNGEALRWKPREILKGKLNDYPLKTAITDKAMCKIDVLAYIQNVYIEFSVVYIFKNKGKILNDFMSGSESDALQADIEEYKKEGNYYKAAKRMYSLKHNKKFLNLFNSPTGAMNQIIANIQTIIYILENKKLIPFRNIDTEIDGFITRLNVFYDNKLNKKLVVNDLLKQAEGTKSKNTLMKLLKEVEEILYKIVQAESKQFLKL